MGVQKKSIYHPSSRSVGEKEHGMNKGYRHVKMIMIRYALTCVLLCTATQSASGEMARGIVYHDRNENGIRDAGESGLGGVRVSNCVDVTVTAPDGSYELPVDDDTILFVAKPRGWRTPLNELNLPQFYYIHKPNGSPDDKFRYAGVEPTGPLPESVDFPLRPSPEPDDFSVVFVGDPQPSNPEEIRHFANDVVAELVDVEAAFGMSMGDIVGNVLRHFPDVNRVQATVGIPWYNVFGNHDMNYDSPNNEFADETFERVYGPTDHVFQFGGVHFIVLNNVYYNGVKFDENGTVLDGGYSGRLLPNQLLFVRNYVATVPRDERIVICTHIPLTPSESKSKSTAETPELLALLKDHPHSISFSAHTHYMRTDQMRSDGTLASYWDHHPHENDDQGDGHEHSHVHEHSHEHHGHETALHHHHNVVTGSGSWYRGPLDETGIPMTPMSDGTPNGYLVARFSGNDYSFRYKAARMPADYQIGLHTDDVIAADDTGSAVVLANVFAGSSHSQVRMRVRRHGDWITMKQSPQIWPPYQAAYDRDQAIQDPPYRPLPTPKTTPHIWQANLPAHLPPGVHILEVQAVDMFDQKDRGIRLIQVGKTIGHKYIPR